MTPRARLAAAWIPALALVLSWGPEAMPGWQERRYRGRTEYTPLIAAGDTTLRAVARGASSALLHPLGCDPHGARLEWRWRVLAHPEGADPGVRARDDRAAGVIVIVRRGWFPWSIRALLYQWTPAAAPGVWSRSPYSGNVRTLVLRSDPADSTWRTEHRDLGADLARAFGETPESIEAIGVICDADNTGATAAAEFGAIRWIEGAAADTAGAGRR